MLYFTALRDLAHHQTAVERGTHDELLEKGGIYAHYYQMQSRESGGGTYRAAPAVDTEKIAQLQQTIQTEREMMSNDTIY